MSECQDERDSLAHGVAAYAMEFVSYQDAERLSPDPAWDRHQHAALIGYLGSLDVRNIDALVVGVRHKEPDSELGQAVLGYSGSPIVGILVATALQAFVVQDSEQDGFNLAALEEKLEADCELESAECCTSEYMSSLVEVAVNRNLSEDEPQFVLTYCEDLPGFFPDSHALFSNLV